MIINILLFLLMLSIIVVVHEFGHLIVAKLFNVYCAEFSVGMGPKLFSKKGKETEYCIRAIPYGGFVAMAGDTDNELETKVDMSKVPHERTLKGISAPKKIAIMLAGITMNILLATLIMSILLLHNGSYALSPEASIKTVEPGYPAAEVGIKANDKILGATLENGSSIKPKNFTELSTFISTYDGIGKIYFELERDGEIINVGVKPRFVEEENRYMIGITAPDYKIVDVNIFNCWGYALDHLFMITRLLLSSLKDLFFGRGFQNVSGPIGIYNTTSEAIALGPSYYFELLALISLNVGVFNALPLPILDGGRVVMTLIEMITGKELPEKITNAAMTISLIMIAILIVLATYQDIMRLLG